jgi:8-oxo-dGTP pyrophosphatase MutT (NUDIX family)
MSRIDVTVAAVVECDQRYLLVEEYASGKRVFNQPAGHVEPGESLLQAVIRESREETGLVFLPSAVVGIYQWQTEDGERSFLRIAFTGSVETGGPTCPLDDGIIATHWLDRAQVAQRTESLRSPMVLRCIDDHRAGIRYPLDCLTNLTGSSQRGFVSVRSRRAG